MLLVSWEKQTSWVFRNNCTLKGVSQMFEGDHGRANAEWSNGNFCVDSQISTVLLFSVAFSHSSAAVHHGFQGKAGMRMLSKLLSPVSLWNSVGKCAQRVLSTWMFSRRDQALVTWLCLWHSQGSSFCLGNSGKVHVLNELARNSLTVWFLAEGLIW